MPAKTAARVGPWDTASERLSKLRKGHPMPSSNYIPSRDDDFAAFATQFSAKITLAPTSYSLVAADATALAALVLSFTNALAAVNDDATKTKVTVAVKDTARL